MQPAEWNKPNGGGAQQIQPSLEMAIMNQQLQNAGRGSRNASITPTRGQQRGMTLSGVTPSGTIPSV